MARLGVLFLSNDITYHGEDPEFGPSMADSRRYDHAPIVRQVPGAWTSNVISGDPACEDAYVKAAQKLVDEGANAITCDCGFTLRYQQAIAAAVAVPVSTSSLLMLPMLLSTVPANKKIAVLTADSRHLDDSMLASLGITQPGRLVIEGWEGTATYSFFSARKGEINVAEVLADTDKIIARVRRHDNIAAILCECTTFVRVSPRIRKATRLPVYDAGNNVTLLLAAAG